MSRYLPITPRLCVHFEGRRRIGKLSEETMASAIQSAPLGRIVYEKVTGAQARTVNCLIASCADDLVFSASKSTGIAAIVRKYARHRVVAELQEIPGEEQDAAYQLSMIRVAQG
jgi:hypothetical protein